MPREKLSYYWNMEIKNDSITTWKSLVGKISKDAVAIFEEKSDVKNQKLSRQKFKNKKNDKLKNEGWKVARIWEHDLNKTSMRVPYKVIKFLKEI